MLPSVHTAIKNPIAMHKLRDCDAGNVNDVDSGACSGGQFRVQKALSTVAKEARAVVAGEARGVFAWKHHGVLLGLGTSI